MRHDCRDWHLQNFGDFAVGQAFDVSQVNRLALGFRQRIHTANDLCGHYMRLSSKRAAIFCVGRCRGLTDAPSAYFVAPDRMQDAQQPALHARARHVMVRAFQCARTRGVRQILGHMPIAREQQTVAPQPCQMLSEFSSEGLLSDDDGFPY